MDIRIGVVLVATGPNYQEFSRRLIPQIRGKLTVYPKSVFLVTDAEESSEADETLRVEHLPMPLPSLLRYHWICRLANRLKDFSHIFYLDTDLEIVEPIGDEVLQPVIAVRHWIWPTPDLAASAPFERRKESLAFLDSAEAGQYVQGSFQGGEAARYLEIAAVLRDRINRDLHRGPFNESMIGLWWDESYWNWWVNTNLREVTLLPPEYALGNCRWSYLPQVLKKPIIKMLQKDQKECWTWRGVANPPAADVSHEAAPPFEDTFATLDNLEYVPVIDEREALPSPKSEDPSLIQFLDSLAPSYSRVGHGALGVGGDLGYENKRVRIAGESPVHPLSAHGPSRILFDLFVPDYSQLVTKVAFNDDIAHADTHANFEIFGDGKLLAERKGVRPGDAAQEMVADLTGVQSLELVVWSPRKTNAHTVWIDPQLIVAKPPPVPSDLRDCLSRVRIEETVGETGADLCIATLASAGFEDLLDNMLGSLVANGNCPEALLVVFNIDNSAEVNRVARKYSARNIACRALVPLTPAIKSVLYSVASAVDAKRFLCLDCDTLILSDIRPLADAILAAQPNAILICREANARLHKSLEFALSTVYHGNEGDFERILGRPANVQEYPLVVNDGVFGGTRQALLTLDRQIRAMPGAIEWTDETKKVGLRNQFILNLALALSNAAVEISAVYNLQLHAQDVELVQGTGRPAARWNGEEVHILHFCGAGRRKYPCFKHSYSRVVDPLPFAGGGDSYAAFVKALRAWIGRYGLKVLRWSFYGKSDGENAFVADSSVFPLFAQLHYLLRSNGVVSVLETGTARGVATACLASAVAHREGAHVVSFDVHSFPEREVLWNLLPDGFRKCIDPRLGNCIDGMKSLQNTDERFDLALLDTLHEESHVLKEFHLAHQLVKPGGLMLIHDPFLSVGSVGQALKQIEGDGFPVTRLWNGASGIHEDDTLGLAVVQKPSA